MDNVMILLVFGGVIAIRASLALKPAESVPTELKNEEIKVLLDLHNGFRRKVDPPGSNIRLLTWDGNLAGRAQAYANKCKFDHSQLSLMEPYGYIGESIYITSRHFVDSVNIGRAVTAWFNEKNFYDFETNVCEENRVCGHYTQTVWDNTYSVGCGKTKCNNTLKVGSRTYTNPTIVVCKYGPSGNVKTLFSPKPRRPYKKGDWCSSCPEEAPLCVDRLCNDAKSVTEPESTTKMSQKATQTSKLSIEKQPPKSPNPKPKALPLPTGVSQTVETLPTAQKVDRNITSPSVAYRTETSTKPVVFVAPYDGLQCFACDGKDSTEACVELNQTEKCKPQDISSVDMLSVQDKPWSCTRYEEGDQVKMKCVLTSECEALKEKSGATCCETDFCNDAKKLEFARHSTLSIVALVTLIELFS